MNYTEKVMATGSEYEHYYIITSKKQIISMSIAFDKGAHDFLKILLNLGSSLFWSIIFALLYNTTDCDTYLFIKYYYYIISKKLFFFNLIINIQL